MQTLMQILDAAVSTALTKIAPEADLPQQKVVFSQNPKFGDYQCNLALALAKQLKSNPRALAQQLVEALEVDDLCEPLEIAGPGFINFRVKPELFAARAREVVMDSRLGIPRTEKPQRVLVDFSGPNLAKEMHVGHLRSTIIGDSIARFYEFAGDEVLRMNHVGDWGTQFGMLINYIRETMPEALANPQSFAISDLEEFYRNAKKCFDDSEAFAEASRRAVVDLQGGDQATLKIWQVFCDESLKHCHEIYQQLDISLQDRGESAYNEMLPKVVEDLKTAGHAVETQGAWGVFLPGYVNKDDEPIPTLVQKSDGGYIYATTDLAALRYRFSEQKADKAVYITDARQSSHFDQVFTIADMMKWAPKDELQHIGFGMMLGKDGKPFKTRTGGTVKLKDLLLEAEERALALARELSPDLSEEEYREVAEVCGRGGVKYSDLSHGIGTDYKFDWDKMLATDGNSAVYVLMSYARTRGLARKSGYDTNALIAEVGFSAGTEQEQKLIKKIECTADIWRNVFNELAPNQLLNHLYELARDFGSFYNACPVLKLEDEELKKQRLALAAAAGRVIEWGMSLVGIRVLEKI